MFALQEDIGSQLVEERHFLSALETVTPRISRDLIDFYEQFQQKSGLNAVWYLWFVLKHKNEALFFSTAVKALIITIKLIKCKSFKKK